MDSFFKQCKLGIALLILWFSGGSNDKDGSHRGESTVYKIYEAENKNALQIQNGTAENGENACAKKPYRAYEWDLWYVEPMANGTYRIKSLMGTYLSTASTGTSPMNVVLKSHINSNTDFSQRWKIINAEY